MQTLLIAAALALTAPLLFGQSAPGGAGTNTGASQTSPTPVDFLQDGIWNGSFNGGRYLLKSNQIIALSKHEYVADAVARVVEINLTLNSNSHVRFYFLEPVKLEGGGIVGAGQQALDRARAMAEQAAARISPTLVEPKVVKNYPVSTHAHTIEFVIKDEARLNSLFESLEGAFRDPRRKIFWRE